MSDESRFISNGLRLLHHEGHKVRKVKSKEFSISSCFSYTSWLKTMSLQHYHYAVGRLAFTGLVHGDDAVFEFSAARLVD